MSLEGKLEDLGLSDIFQILNLSRRTGTLTIRRKEGKGLIVFNHGQVVYASIEDKKSLADICLKAGFCLTRHWKKPCVFRKPAVPESS